MKESEDSQYGVLFNQMGLSLFASQRVEFILQIVLNVLGLYLSDKEAKKYKPEVYLEDSERGRKIRKKTLGTLSNKLKKVDFINHERLDNYVQKRNYIIHNLWREELNGSIPNKNFKKCIQLCNEFIDESNNIENSLKGIMNLVFIYLQENKNIKEAPSADNWAEFRKDLDILIK
ncbi:hypothetical protein ACE01N_20470 [Saccharicrinis sp. FJH2]|uniref:hypothetical protein n=1 Tax=Saccharicrinis sp. FJH65 TaxID=3344659 RepID=UPI0035F46CC1